MFVWLASYPKSGNTLLRALLASYFFSNNGNLKFNLIKNIRQFPSIRLFEEMGIDITQEEEVIKNYLKAQEYINKKNSLQFLKTHSSLFNFKGHAFTNLKNSLGAIYIVRDPRNVVTSWANHDSISFEQSANNLIDKSYKIGGLKNYKKEIVSYTGSWNFNYNSWKEFKAYDKYLLIKYEDLVKDKEKFFIKVLKFLHKARNIDFELDKKKLQNVLISTSFDKMKEMEEKEGFHEAAVSKNDNEKKPFFFKGPKNNWKNTLSRELIKKIEKAFEKEMLELEYL
tara:strand:- start:450 stop:1298 length:849 start_codon:yes stop_codon:yes gene_type:complete